jgi:hypothetical protein
LPITVGVMGILFFVAMNVRTQPEVASAIVLLREPAHELLLGDAIRLAGVTVRQFIWHEGPPDDQALLYARRSRDGSDTNPNDEIGQRLQEEAKEALARGGALVTLVLDASQRTLVTGLYESMAVIAAAPDVSAPSEDL